MVGRGFVFFPLIIHAFDLLVSSVGALAVRLRKPSHEVSRIDILRKPAFLVHVSAIERG